MHRINRLKEKKRKDQAARKRNEQRISKDLSEHFDFIWEFVCYRRSHLPLRPPLTWASWLFSKSLLCTRKRMRYCQENQHIDCGEDPPFPPLSLFPILCQLAVRFGAPLIWLRRKSVRRSVRLVGFDHVIAWCLRTSLTGVPSDGSVSHKGDEAWKNTALRWVRSQSCALQVVRH